MWLLDWPLIGVYSHWCIRNSKKGMGVATGVVVGIYILVQLAGTTVILSDSLIGRGMGHGYLPLELWVDVMVIICRRELSNQSLCQLQVK